MSRFPRLRRRPDHFSSAHERARVRASERLDGPLGLAETTWLDAHLAECAACAAVAAAYEADRVALQSLRTSLPEPPRDLWARTAAAIEHDAAGRRSPRGRKSGRRTMPLGALSGVAVIAVVVGASVVSQSLVPPTGELSAVGSALDGGAAPSGIADGGAESTGSIARVQPTPFAVGAGEVQWVRANLDGTLAYNVARVDEVCPVEAKAGCATVPEGADRRLQLDAEPQSIIASPDDSTTVVVSRDAAGNQQVIVVDLDEDVDPSPTSAPAATPGPTQSAVPPSAAPETGPPRGSGESAPPSGDPTEEPTAPPTAAPTEPTAGPTAEPTGGDTSASVAPETAQPTDQPVESAEVNQTISPEPTVAASLAIASDIEVVGQSAAFSADGSWFAFTAQPADGSGGPNVYVWRVGSPDATQLTVDDRSIFASWADGDLLVSRPVGRDRGRPTAATNVRIDPLTGEERPAPAGWRPTLDPTRTLAVTWTGGIVEDETGTWRPESGTLVLGGWADDDAPTSAVEETVLFEGDAIGDFDVRWDETGEWFAVWIADEADPTVGQLDLYRVDPETGAVDQPSGAPVDVRALAGFSIGDGRLAWATPPGQAGEGSRVQIVAWNAEGVGTIETAPGEDVVVIR